MNASEIAYQRLYNQQISRPQFRNPEEVVKHMGVVQAQDYYASLWAIGLRTASPVTDTAIQQTAADRKIVRTWPMRGTLHFVTAEDVRWMLKLLTPRVIRSSAGRHRDLELDESVFTKSRKLIERALQGGKQLTRPKVYEVLEEGGVSPEGQRGYHILGYLAQNALICWGPRAGKQHTLVLMDEWIPEGRSLDGDEALAELAARYIASRGPATEYDFAYWSGLTVTTARKALQLVDNRFEKEQIDGQTYWFPAPAETVPEEASGTHLLPGFDEMLCGYKDRSAILKSDHQKSVILRNGILKPVIISKGKMIGSWKRTLKKERVVIEAELFQNVDKKEQIAIKCAAIQYGYFLDLDTEFMAT